MLVFYRFMLINYARYATTVFDTRTLSGKWKPYPPFMPPSTSGIDREDPIKAVSIADFIACTIPWELTVRSRGY